MGKDPKQWVIVFCQDATWDFALSYSEGEYSPLIGMAYADLKPTLSRMKHTAAPVSSNLDIQDRSRGHHHQQRPFGAGLKAILAELTSIGS